jgi:hypothetical protein
MREMLYRVGLRKIKLKFKNLKKWMQRYYLRIDLDRYCYITGRSQRSSKMYEKLTIFLINFEGVKEMSTLRVPFPELRRL